MGSMIKRILTEHCYRNLKVELANMIRKAGKEIRDGQYGYMLSKDDQYLNRIRHKEEPDKPQ